jgi:biotin carboxyl carrier protein
MQKDFHKISQISVGESVFKAEDLKSSDFDLVQIDNKHYHILLGESSIEAECTYADLDQKIIHLRIEGTLYKVQLQNNLDDLVQTLGFNLKSESREKEIKAPMPGLVLKVMVNVNEEVKEGQELLILEAMKMENIIQAPTSGIIESISVSDGDAVEKNQVLISFKDE